GRLLLVALGEGERREGPRLADGPVGVDDLDALVGVDGAALDVEDAAAGRLEAEEAEAVLPRGEERAVAPVDRAAVLGGGERLARARVDVHPAAALPVFPPEHARVAAHLRAAVVVGGDVDGGEA